MPTVELRDGRTLAFEVGGDPAGEPVLFFHGTGDSRLARHPDDGLTASLGVRLVTVDRPGVGGSTRLADRTLLDWPPDVAALADALGIERFAVGGWSGGGPHALATAHALGERVTRVALASPLAPFDRPGNRDLVENSDLRMIWRLSHVKWVAAAAGRAESKSAVKDMHKFVAGIAKGAPADAAVLSDPVLEPMFEAEMAEALAQHGSGVLDDMWAFLDWGFAPEDITQRAEVFYGTKDDILSPEMYRGLVERLPDAGSAEWEGEGHYAVFANWEQFMGAARG